MPQEIAPVMNINIVREVLCVIISFFLCVSQ